MNIPVIIMASGFGRRFGDNKLMAEYKGKPLYQWALETATGSGAASVTVVTAHKDLMEHIKAEYPDVRVIENANPQRGISESVKLGLKANIVADPDGCCFMVCDQPELTMESLRELLGRFTEEPDAIWLVSDGKKRGNPVIFPASCFHELMELTGDVGGRQVIKKHPELVRELFIKNPSELIDIDYKTDII